MNIKKRGFTLIEVLVVMGIIAVLATIVLVAVNPGRQFAQARDTQRVSNVNTLLNAVGQRIADHRGVFEDACTAGAIPSTATLMSNTGYNIYPCLVPDYLPALPLDPTAGSFTSSSSYNTGYTILKETSTGRITITASSTEIGSIIQVSR